MSYLAGPHLVQIFIEVHVSHCWKTLAGLRFQQCRAELLCRQNEEAGCLCESADSLSPPDLCHNVEGCYG